MRIQLVCLEDGIMACGFRKMAAFVESLNEDTRTSFVSTNNYRSLVSIFRGRSGDRGMMEPDLVDEIAQGLADADLVGFSSMTGYADLTKAIIHRLREITRRPFLVWGGIHPIIHPTDAIEADVDAICTGEGEFAFAEFFDLFQRGRDHSSVRNFWFRSADGIRRNPFLPLMKPEEMETLPFAKYGGREWYYTAGRGFRPMTWRDYVASNGLSYNAVWSIGCPLHCTFCGNTKFIANDPLYKKIRHPSARYIVEEVKAVRRTFPHISTVVFHDDSFLALPLGQIEEFAELWRAEVGVPFAVQGVIPSYVRADKLEILTWAGLNRIRMGIQSGSQRILDFYKRPTPIDKVESAAVIAASFAPRYHIPPAYDMILDNPIETRQDVCDTLELIYRLKRPFTLNLFSLKVIPNTQLEKDMRERGLDVEQISASYVDIPPRWANLVAYLLTFWKPPRRVFDWLLRRAEASGTPQKSHPILGFLLRLTYLTTRAIRHLRFMDFSTIPGLGGYVAWRTGLVGYWWTHLNPRPPRHQPARAVDTVLLPTISAPTESA